MAWKKVSLEMSAFLESVLAAYPAQKKTMFGCPVWMVNGNMFAGLHQDTIFIRLSPTDRDDLQAQWDEALPFEPMPGMKMKEYRVVPEDLAHQSEEFHLWLRRSYQYVAMLPPKAPKATKARGKKPPAKK